MKRQAFYSCAGAMGDLICATPTIKKLSEIYQSKITVISNHPYLFKNCPYIDKSIKYGEYTEEQLSIEYDLHKTFFLLGKRDSQGIEFKHAICDIRQYHAKDLGFMLTNNELQCDYFAGPDDLSVKLPEKFVVIHPSQSWDSRTWSKENWQSLCDELYKLGIPVVSVGKNTSEDSKYYKNNEKPIYELDIKNGKDLTNKTSLDQTWHILNKSSCVITMDSGILHLAGTTNTYIIQLGSSINPEFRAPYRNGSQNYKYSYIVGDCKLHCASDLKYSLRDWGNIQSVTLIGNCLENKPKFECNPSFIPVLEKIKQVYDIPNEEIKILKSEKINSTIVEIESDALGDNIGAVSIIEKYKNESKENISVLCNFPDIFRNSYPDINFYKKSKTSISYSTSDGLWSLNNQKFNKLIKTTYKFDVPLLDGYAKDFNITSHGSILKVDKTNKERPIKSKYVCIGIHSTTQAKYWNYPGGWDDICKWLRKKGLTPVCVEKDYSFGIEGNMNEVPHRSVKKIGMQFNDVINHIQHAEFFIGLSSGLSWLAQGLGVPTVIISNTTSKNNEYIDDKTLRIYDESVCHGCFHKYVFNPQDWLWCPIYRNDDDRRFICTKAITPESVIEKIEKFFNL